jgi:Na+/melibiose symporter-like transporter
MSLIAFYGSLSQVCATDAQRLRVSSFKSFFDTITYCLVYALVPIVLDGLNIHIDQFALILIPLMATMLIPLFMIKEGERFEKKLLKKDMTLHHLQKKNV